MNTNTFNTILLIPTTMIFLITILFKFGVLAFKRRPISPLIRLMRIINRFRSFINSNRIFVFEMVRTIKFILKFLPYHFKVGSSGILFLAILWPPILTFSLPYYFICCFITSKYFLDYGFDFDFLKSLIPIFEDTIIVFSALKDCKSMKAKLSVVLLVIKKQWKCDSVLLTSIEALEKSNFSLKDFYSTFSTEVSLQDDDFDFNFLDSLETKLDKWDQLRESPLWKHLRKIYILVLASNIFGRFGLSFDKRGYTAMEQALCAKEVEFGSDGAILHLLRAVHFVCTSGISIYRTGNADALLFANQKHQKWEVMYQWLMSSHYYLRNPGGASIMHDPTGSPFSESLYFSRLAITIDEGLAMQRVLSVSKPRFYTSFSTKVLSLRKLQGDLLSKTACDSVRDLPFSILVYGSPGVGKTSFSDVLFNTFGTYSTPNKPKLPCESHFKYVRNFTAKYWDNFKTSMWCVILDDIGFQKVEVAKSGGDPSVMEVIQIVNSVPFVPDQAALEDKGRTPLRAQLVIGTTNTKNLNSPSYFSCPSAALRRFPYIVTLTVKDIYALAGSTQLDPNKVDSGAYLGRVPNFWRIKVDKVVVDPMHDHLVLYETVIDTSDITHFLEWYCEAISIHYERLADFKQKSETLGSFTLCDKCFRDSDCCLCNVSLQSHHHFPWWCNALYYYLDTSDLFLNFILSPFGIVFDPNVLFCRLTSYDMDRFGLTIFKPVKYYEMKVSLLFSLLASLMLVLMKCYKIYKSSSLVLQGQSIPKPYGDEKKNVWHANDLPLADLYISDSSKCESSHDIIRKIHSNVVNINIHTANGTKKRLRALGVYENFYITTHHSFLNTGTEFFTIDVIGSPKSSVDMNSTFNIPKHLVQNIGDICMFQLPGRNPCKNILKYFPLENEFRWAGGGTILTRNHFSGCQDKASLHSLKWVRKIIDNVKFDGFQYCSENILSAGTCGSPILVSTRGSGCNVILGIHGAGPSDAKVEQELHITNTITGYSHGVSQEIITKLRSNFGAFSTLSQNSRPLGSVSVQDGIVNLHYKSTVNFIEKGTCNVYGSLSIPRFKSVSNVQPHFLRDYFLEYGYTVNSFKPNLVSWQPWRTALLDTLDPVRNINPIFLERAKKGYLQDILSEIDLEMVKLMVHPIDDAFAINGAPDVAFIDALPRGTSAGYPWNCSKRKLGTLDPPSTYHADPISFNAEIMSRVNDIEDLYDRGLRASPVFTAHLKDEPVSSKKLKTGKVRVFSGTPLDFTIVVRKNLMGFVRCVQRHRHVFEACPGLIAQSQEWHDMYFDLTVFGSDKMVAGDFKAFDKRMAAEFMLSAFEIIYDLCRLSSNFSTQELLRIRGIATDITFAFTNFNGDLLEFLGSNPSGHPLTVIINSMCNSLYMRYAYAYLHRDNSCADFRKNVILRTYGDDNILNSNNEWFNHTSISSALASIGVTYTMADKEAESVPFININECSFLKREWRYDPDLDQYMAMLDHGSITKMLTTWVVSKSVSPEEQAFSTVQTACREYFYYGKEIFNDKRSMFLDVCKKAKLTFLLEDQPLPTWDELAEAYFIARRKPLYEEESLVSLQDDEFLSAHFICSYNYLKRCCIATFTHIDVLLWDIAIVMQMYHPAAFRTNAIHQQIDAKSVPLVRNPFDRSLIIWTNIIIICCFLLMRYIFISLGVGPYMGLFVFLNEWYLAPPYKFDYTVPTIDREEHTLKMIGSCVALSCYYYFIVFPLQRYLWNMVW